MIINFEGRPIEWDHEHVSLDEWREIKRKYGLSIGKFMEGIGELDPDALTCLVWLLRRQAGDQRIVLGDTVKYDVAALINELNSAAEEVQKDQQPEVIAPEAAPPVPTVPPGPSADPASPMSASPTATTLDGQPPSLVPARSNGSSPATSTTSGTGTSPDSLPSFISASRTPGSSP